ncbi:hypothetical protein FD755_022829 [Muntiacus reevesi]|uniref:DNAJC9 HTH domain-containing protein n=1 Tax=Muntiacus reevesi TaxID=9886 RepID=A0A5N3VYK8_MUNRE|nr:hypothetical protein FD755_022829 [Muntiacus reevesi]
MYTLRSFYPLCFFKKKNLNFFKVVVGTHQVHRTREGILNQEGEVEKHKAPGPPAAPWSSSILGKVSSVLSDEEQRTLYDEQGTRISLEDIQDFAETYKGSEEELTDIKQAHLDFKGDMDQIMESVLCVQYAEEPRIRHIIQQAVDAGEAPSYKAFGEAKEAEMSRKEMGLDEGIQKDRQKEMDNFLAPMEGKYCKPFKRGGKKTALKKEKNNGIFSSKVHRC